MYFSVRARAPASGCVLKNFALFFYDEWEHKDDVIFIVSTI